MAYQPPKSPEQYEAFVQTELPDENLATIVGGFESNDDGLYSGAMAIESQKQRFRLGVGNEVVIADAIDRTYRFWVGHSVPSSAPFSVTKAGVVTATGVNVQQNFTAAETIATGNAIAIGPYQSDGGITTDTSTSAVDSRPAHTTSRTYSFTVGNNSNRILIFVVATTNDAGANAFTATYNGVSMTRVVGFAGTGSMYLNIFYLLAPATGANNLVVSGLVDSGAGVDIRYAIYSYYNVVQQAPTATTTTNFSAGSITQNITIPSNGARVFTAIMNSSASGAYSAPSNIGGNSTSGNTSGNGGAGYYFGDSYKLPNKITIACGVTHSGTNDFGMGSLTLEAITAPSQRSFKASADNGSTYDWATNWKANAFVGFASGAATTGSLGPVIVAGVPTGLSGLSVTAQYYLSDTAGQISTTVGTNTRKVGIAIESTSLTITNIW